MNDIMWYISSFSWFTLFSLEFVHWISALVFLFYSRTGCVKLLAAFYLHELWTIVNFNCVFTQLAPGVCCKTYHTLATSCIVTVQSVHIVFQIWIKYSNANFYCFILFVFHHVFIHKKFPFFLLSVINCFLG